MAPKGTEATISTFICGQRAETICQALIRRRPPRRGIASPVRILYVFLTSDKSHGFLYSASIAHIVRRIMPKLYSPFHSTVTMLFITAVIIGNLRVATLVHIISFASFLDLDIVQVRVAERKHVHISCAVGRSPYHGYYVRK